MSRIGRTCGTRCRALLLRLHACDPMVFRGNPDGLQAFLIDPSAEVGRVVPELVLLKSVQAGFLVKMSAPP